jgi:hypothetical protein
MKIYSTAIAIALAAFLGAAECKAQPEGATAGEFTKVGLAGGQFLKIGAGARATGMAGAFAGISDDVSSMFWNPAGIAEVKAYSADVSNTFWFAGMQHQFVGAVIPVSEKFRLGVNFLSFGSGDIRRTTMADPEGETGGIYSANDIALGFTFAGKLTSQFAFGVTARYVQHAFSNVSAGGFVFDVGTRYNTGFNGVSLGFGINSMGPQQQFEGADLTRQFRENSGLTNTAPRDFSMNTSPFNIPLSFRAGLGIDMFQGWVAEKPEVDVDGVQVHQWLVGLDFETYSDVPEQYAIGTEYTWNELVAVRAGYRFGHDQMGFAAGLGLRYESSDFRGQIDYSVNPTANIGLINRLSLVLNFY